MGDEKVFCQLFWTIVWKRISQRFIRRISQKKFSKSWFGKEISWKSWNFHDFHHFDTLFSIKSESFHVFWTFPEFLTFDGCVSDNIENLRWGGRTCRLRNLCRVRSLRAYHFQNENLKEDVKVNLKGDWKDNLMWKGATRCCWQSFRWKLLLSLSPPGYFCLAVPYHGGKQCPHSEWFCDVDGWMIVRLGAVQILKVAFFHVDWVLSHFQNMLFCYTFSLGFDQISLRKLLGDKGPCTQKFPWETFLRSCAESLCKNAQFRF